jgi:hypothetical protein
MPVSSPVSKSARQEYPAHHQEQAQAQGQQPIWRFGLAGDWQRLAA